MSGWLLDTNVVSAFAPGRPQVAPALVEWLHINSANLFLSVVTAAEIQAGIAKLHRRGADQRADRLNVWLDQLLEAYAHRVLPFDIHDARIAGAMTDHALAGGAAPGLADLFIAATASQRNLTILTVNLRHFEPLGVEVRDPFQQVPPT